MANQLHDLWNFLIFESDGNIESVKQIALKELNDSLRAFVFGSWAWWIREGNNEKYFFEIPLDILNC